LAATSPLNPSQSPRQPAPDAAAPAAAKTPPTPRRPMRQVPGDAPTERPKVPAAPPQPARPEGRVIPVGRRYERGTLGDAVALKANLLASHIAILAGSGSGKTVLLRRIVEEAALLGIPSIVLDPNNDLSRLGDAWPARPDSWSDEEAAKAAAYRARADVVIW